MLQNKLNNMNEGKRKKVIGVWFIIGVGMLLGQIILGGITRLTGSGLYSYRNQNNFRRTATHE